MSLKDLIAKTLNHTVTRTDGMGEQVLYTSKSGGTAKTPVNTIVERDLAEDDLGKENKEFTLFHGLHLDQKPGQGDTIEFDGEVWTYHRTKDHIGNSYDVIAYVKRHTIGRSVVR